MDLRDHGVIDVLKIGAEVAGIGQVGTIQCERNASDRSTVGGVGGLLANLHLRKIRGGVGGAKVADGEAGEDLEQLGRVASLNGKLVELVGADGGAQLTIVQRDAAYGLLNGNGLCGAADVQPDVGDGAVVARVQMNAIADEGGKASPFHGEVVV